MSSKKKKKKQSVVEEEAQLQQQLLLLATTTTSTPGRYLSASTATCSVLSNRTNNSDFSHNSCSNSNSNSNSNLRAQLTQSADCVRGPVRSLTSTLSGNLNQSAPEDDEVSSTNQAIIDNIEALFEKRTATRVAALKALGSALRLQVCKECLESRVETLISSLTRSLGRGVNENEFSLACDIVSLISITFGQHQGWYNAISKPLVSYLSNIKIGGSPTLFSASARALSYACFFSSTAEEDTATCLSLFEQMILDPADGSSSESLTAALSGLILLLTTIPLSDISQLFSQ